MIDHYAAQLALRAKLLTLSVATTGSASISATATDYQRTTGSFVTDGFKPGMEVTGSGFSNAENNAAKTITAVAASTLTCAGNVAETAGTRTLTVGLPAGRAWENNTFTPVDGEPYVVENYLPGPTARETLGSFAELEVLPQYVVRLYAPQNNGMGATRKYTDALLALFAPNTPFVLSEGTLRVRGDIGPFPGQMLPTEDGFVVTPVTVPLRYRTANTI